MSPYFSRTGDDGSTSLLGQGRIPKDDLRMEVLGTLDEANSALGIARATCTQPEIPEILLTVQRHLYQLMAEISATPENAARFRMISAEHIHWLEEKAATIGMTFQMPKEFILPGDTLGGGFLDLARTMIRTAERRVCALIKQEGLDNPHILPYLNRLSSLCFVLELWEINQSGDSNISLARNEGS